MADALTVDRYAQLAQLLNQRGGRQAGMGIPPDTFDERWDPLPSAFQPPPAPADTFAGRWGDMSTNMARREEGNPARAMRQMGLNQHTTDVLSGALRNAADYYKVPGDILAGKYTPQPADPGVWSEYDQEARNRGADQLTRAAPMMAMEGLGGGMAFANETKGALGSAGGRPPKLNLVDDGSRLRLEPEGMTIPDWGKGLSWGMTAFRGPLRGENSLYVRDARLPPEMQGQGLGTAMYQHLADIAAKERLPFLSDGSVTGDAARVWDALQRRGYNVERNPNANFVQGPEDARAQGLNLDRYMTEDGSPVYRIPQPSGMGIRAYHGSPYDFDRFDSSKTNTGLHFDENPEYARRYTMGGPLYEVNIRADPEHFLDLNKPISEHSDHVRSAIDKISADVPSISGHKDANSIYNALARGLTPEGGYFREGLVKAQERLHDAGITGVKYGSTYVGVDDKLVDILRKYSIAGMLGAPVAAAAGASQQGPQP